MTAIAEAVQDRALLRIPGQHPRSYCESVGMASRHVVLVHMTQPDDTDIATVAHTGMHLEHCHIKT